MKQVNGFFTFTPYLAILLLNLVKYFVNMDDNQLLEYILNAILILIGLYQAFFKSYFTEKGKRLAVKEDIEEITEKIERIKSEFNRRRKCCRSLKILII